MAIKPSGVEYDVMKAEDIVLVDLDGHVVEGNLKPSSDLATHLEFYRNWPNVNGVVHTHSPWATSFAQAGLDLLAARHDTGGLFLRFYSMHSSDERSGNSWRI